MAIAFTCPQGHRWEISGSSQAETIDTEVPCPVCGALVSSSSGSAAAAEEAEAATMPPRTALAGNPDAQPPTLPPRSDLQVEECIEPEVLATESIPVSEDAELPTVAGYEILGVLGRGGMGIVYKARQVSLKRVVALKMILAGAHAGPQDLARFRSEAEAVARLNHPNIIQIHEIGESEGLPYFSLEFLSGGSLAHKLAGTPLPAPLAARLLETLAQAVHYAHSHRIIHRDLKPANVLLTGGSDTPIQRCTAKITDFGLAKQLDAERGQTREGVVLGTPSYMAPEQAEGRVKEIGPATDVYALGAILYEMLTGRPPFKAANHLDTILQVLAEEPVPPRRLQPKIPRDLETICLKCLEKEPRKRYASAQALAEDLERFRQGEPIRARPVGILTLARKWAKRQPVLALLLTLLFLGTSASFAVPNWLQRQLKELKGSSTEISRSPSFSLKGHQRRINSVVFRPDGKWIASAGGDPVVKIWDAATGGELRSLGEHADDVSSVAFSPDSRHLAVACWDGAVKLWDLSTGQERHARRSPGRRVCSVTFHPEGTRLAWAGADETVHVWDTTSGQEVLTLRGHGDVVSSVAFSPDGRRLASAGWDGTVRLWDALDGHQTNLCKGHTGPVQSVVFSPDGSRLASAGVDASVRVWDAATGRANVTCRSYDMKEVNSVAFSPDGSRLASADSGGTVLIWDATSGKELRRLQKHSAAVTAVSFSPDGRRLASAGWDKAVQIWDLATDGVVAAKGQ